MIGSQIQLNFLEILSREYMKNRRHLFAGVYFTSSNIIVDKHWCYIDKHWYFILTTSANIDVSAPLFFSHFFSTIFCSFSVTLKSQSPSFFLTLCSYLSLFFYLSLSPCLSQLLRQTNWIEFSADIWQEYIWYMYRTLFSCLFLSVFISLLAI